MKRYAGKKRGRNTVLKQNQTIIFPLFVQESTRPQGWEYGCGFRFSSGNIRPGHVFPASSVFFSPLLASIEKKSAVTLSNQTKRQSARLIQKTGVFPLVFLIRPHCCVVSSLYTAPLSSSRWVTARYATLTSRFHSIVQSQSSVSGGGGTFLWTQSAGRGVVCEFWLQVHLVHGWTPGDSL